MKQIKFLSSIQYFTLIIIKNSQKQELVANDILQVLSALIMDGIGTPTIYKTLGTLVQKNLLEEIKNINNWTFSGKCNNGKRAVRSYKLLPAGEIALNRQEELIKSFKSIQA